MASAAQMASAAIDPVRTHFIFLKKCLHAKGFSKVIEIFTPKNKLLESKEEKLNYKTERLERKEGDAYSNTIKVSDGNIYKFKRLKSCTSVDDIGEFMNKALLDVSDTIGNYLDSIAYSKNDVICLKLFLAAGRLHVNIGYV